MTSQEIAEKIFKDAGIEVSKEILQKTSETIKEVKEIAERKGRIDGERYANFSSDEFSGGR